MNARLLSVIIPCYNPPLDAFAQTIRSLADSTFRDFHLIIVDDGSRDISYLQACKASFPEAQIIYHEQNRGLAAARNSGAAHCQTPLFLQIDADDTISPSFLEKALNALAQHPEWSFCSAWVEGIGARQYLWAKGFDQGRRFLLSNQSTSTAVIRLAADRAIGGHDESIRGGNEDWDYWLRMAANGFWGGTLSEYLIQYRHHEEPTFWPNRDIPMQKARFTLRLWWRYRILFLAGFRGRLSTRAGHFVARGREQGFFAWLKTVLYILLKFIYIFALAVGIPWLYDFRENLRK